MLCPQSELQSLLFVMSDEFMHSCICKSVCRIYSVDHLDIFNSAMALWVDFSGLFAWLLWQL
jgi:hypothetical protein